MHYNHILVTTDFSTNAAAAYELASYQAKFEGSKITLLNVVADWVVPTPMFEYFPNPAQFEEYRESLKKNAEKNLQAIAEKSFHGQRVQILAVPSMESPHKVICDIARSNQCDLIIMAGSGHGAMATVFLGSTVQRVLQGAPCPVMVVPVKR